MGLLKTQWSKTFSRSCEYCCLFSLKYMHKHQTSAHNFSVSPKIYIQSHFECGENKSAHQTTSAFRLCISKTHTQLSCRNNTTLLILNLFMHLQQTFVYFLLLPHLFFTIHCPKSMYRLETPFSIIKFNATIQQQGYKAPECHQYLSNTDN